MRHQWQTGLLFLGFLLGCAPQVPPDEKQQKEAQQQAEAAVEKRARTVKRDESVAGKPIIAADFSHTMTTDADLKNVASLKSLQKLDLYANQVTDAGIKGLAVISTLQELDLSRTGITD